MKEDIKLLKAEFKRIKEMGMIESLREGSTGVGYTFETLLNKKEDQDCKPDFGSLELKCKLGYSRSSLSLFHCVPKRSAESAQKYIFEKYSYHRYGNANDIKLFERKVFSNYAIKRFGYEFKLKVDYYRMEIIMQSFYNREFVENVCYWDFKELENKLKKKLSHLAIIQAYPYRRFDKVYYKYLKMEIFKLYGFFEFLRLIEEDKIFVGFYMKSALDKSIKPNVIDHGVAFRIKNECIEELFYKLKY